MHSLEIVQWDSTRRDHLGYPGRVFGSGLVSTGPTIFASLARCIGKCIIMSKNDGGNIRSSFHR